MDKEFQLYLKELEKNQRTFSSDELGEPKESGEPGGPDYERTKRMLKDAFNSGYKRCLKIDRYSKTLIGETENLIRFFFENSFLVPRFLFAMVQRLIYLLFAIFRFFYFLIQRTLATTFRLFQLPMELLSSATKLIFIYSIFLVADYVLSKPYLIQKITVLFQKMILALQ